MGVHVMFWLYATYFVIISTEVHSTQSLKQSYLAQTDQNRHDAIQQAVNDKMAYFQSKQAQNFGDLKIGHRQYSKKQYAMLTADRKHFSSSQKNTETNERDEEKISETNEQNQVETSNGRFTKQENPTMISEQDATIWDGETVGQRAYIVAPRIRTDSVTWAEISAVAPVAKPLPRLFAGPPSPDTGLAIPQFSGEEVTSPDDCEAVDMVLANGKDSILLQSIRKGIGRNSLRKVVLASEQFEPTEKIVVYSLADRIYNTVLSSKSIDDYDKFVRLKIILIEFIGVNEERARKLLPLRLGEFGNLQQLLTCP